MRRFTGLLLLCAVVLATSFPAQAHNPSDSYLLLDATQADSSVISGRWDIALRDLSYAIGLDADGNGKLTWGEVRQRHPAIASYALSHLSVHNAGKKCTLTPVKQAISRHTGENYTALYFKARCTQPVEKLAITYSLFFNLDPTHRGLLQLKTDNQAYSSVLSPGDPVFRLQQAIASPWRILVDFLWNGIWHIWIGYDHVAFLLLLLLPAVLQRRNKRWEPKPALKPALWEVAAIVTSFTLAHSITLSLSALGIIILPVQFIEMAIAATVVVTGLHNLFPVGIRYRWTIAFAFGLIHGFGFANVLRELGLQGSNLAITLFAFNIGVELGQLTIVLVFVPLAYLLRRTMLYRYGILPVGSLVISILAGWWFIQRAMS